MRSTKRKRKTNRQSTATTTKQKKSSSDTCIHQSTFIPVQKYTQQQGKLIQTETHIAMNRQADCCHHVAFPVGSSLSVRQMRVALPPKKQKSARWDRFSLVSEKTVRHGTILVMKRHEH